MWAGEYVSTQLNVTIDNKENQILNIEDTVGLALRNNPKRAHLLVSKLLGKHIPVPASLIIRSGQILALEAYNALNRRIEPVEGYLRELKECLDGSRDTLMSSMPKLLPVEALVVGYAETATSLGHIVADYLNAPYIHSTRYGKESIVPYGKFEEAHSHATTHQLLPESPDFFTNDLPMVLVDDELSTGKTIIATIDELHALSPRKHYVVCTLIDCRSEKDKEAMRNFADTIGTRIDVVCLSAGVVSYPDSILDDVKPVIESMSSRKSLVDKNSPSVSIVYADYAGFHDAKYGVKTFEDTIAKNIVDALESVEGRTVVLGTEEFMYIPVQVAAEMEKRGYGNVFSSSTTRSPVISYNDSEYAVKHKVTYCLSDGEERFAYNLTGFDTIVIIVNPDMEVNDFLCDQGLVSQLGFTGVKNIILIEQRK